MDSKKLKMTKDKKIILYRVFMCLLGSFVLAFGNAVFLTPANIDAGGVTGIAVVINFFVQQKWGIYVVDIVVLIFNVIFFILAIIFLDKRFIIQTLIATFAVPLFMSLMHYTEMFNFITVLFKEGEHSHLLLAGMFGGLFVGLGCTITFFGDGSTGGTDVLAFILNKYFGIKQSLTSFVWDAVVIIIGMACLRDNMFNNLVGALSVLLSALVIDFLYVQSTNNYIADIVSEKYEEINNFIIKDLDRSTTILTVIGGYTGKERKLIRLVFDKHEFYALKDKIKEIDPKAFVTIYRSKKVLGEGFASMITEKPKNPFKRNKKTSK